MTDNETRGVANRRVRTLRLTSRAAHRGPGRGAQPSGSAPEFAPAPFIGCLGCGYRDRVPLFDLGQYRYVECRRCGLAHLDPMPCEREAQSYFEDSYFNGGVAGGYDDYIADEALHRQNAHLRLKLLTELGTAPPGQLLDVGCAHGFFLDHARASGWTVRGVEVSPVAATNARTHFGLDVVPTLTDAVGEHPGEHDVVTFFQVLEHVASPLDALSQARACLRPDGLLVIETWDRGSAIARVLGSRWQEVAPPSVGWLWNRDTLRLLLATAGFSLTDTRRTSKRVSFRFVASLLDDRGCVSASAARLIRHSPLRSRSFAYRFGDLITVVATPTGAGETRPY
jgi:SAM-dependent methyltransferase